MHLGAEQNEPAAKKEHPPGLTYLANSRAASSKKESSSKIVPGYYPNFACRSSTITSTPKRQAQPLGSVQSLYDLNIATKAKSQRSRQGNFLFYGAFYGSRPSLYCYCRNDLGCCGARRGILVGG